MEYHFVDEDERLGVNDFVTRMPRYELSILVDSRMQLLLLFTAKS
jgi:hypothetical protein